MSNTTFASYLSNEHGGTFTRDPAKCISKLEEMGEGVSSRCVIKEDMYIVIPKRWVYNKLAFMGDEIYITCIFPVVFPNSKVYAVLNQVNRIKIVPDSVSIFKINDEDEYFKFNFEKGSVGFPLLDLPQDDTLAYPIYDELIAKGNVPCYLNYDDTNKVLKTASVTAGINISPSNIILEATVATVSRAAENGKQYYRLTIKGQNDQLTRPPKIIGLRNVILGATNFITRVTGSYAEDGIESSLVSPSTHRERVEDILTA